MSTRPVRDALHAAAETYQPDRAAMLARIRRGQATLDASRPLGRSRQRVAVRAAGVAATVAAVLGLGVAVTWAAVGNPVTRQQPHQAPVAAPAPTDPPGMIQGHGDTARASSTMNASRSAAPSPTKVDVQPSSLSSSYLSSSGAIDAQSLDYWAQSNVTLRTTETVTALQVRVRIALTPYVSSTGFWSTVLTQDLVTSVEQQRDGLVYQFTLKPGSHLAPGSYVFAVQYNHATGSRDRSGDSYQAVAIAGGIRAEVHGGF